MTLYTRISDLLIRGFGLGAVTIPLMTAAFIGLDRRDIPHASIITRIAQQFGGSFGVALLAVILDGALAHTAMNHQAPASAFDQAFWWLIGFTALAVVFSLALPGRTIKQADTPLAAPVPQPGDASSYTSAKDVRE